MFPAAPELSVQRGTRPANGYACRKSLAFTVLLGAGLVTVLSCQAAEVLRANVSNTEQRFEFDVEMTVGVLQNMFGVC